MLVHTRVPACTHPAGALQPLFPPVSTSDEITATRSVPAWVGCGQVAVMLVCEFAVAYAVCRRVICGGSTVTVAVLLLTLAVPLHVLVTRAQYDFVAVSA